MGASVLSHDEFFIGLGGLLKGLQAADHGAVYLVQKQLSYGQSVPSPSSDDPVPGHDPTQPLPVLVRAAHRRSKSEKAKLCTIVQPPELDAFYARYAETCRAAMTSLKPRDKNKKKAKAKKKKSIAHSAGVAKAVPAASRNA